MKALKVLKQALKRYLVHENDIREAIDELEVLQKSEQKSYAIGYTQGYLDCENNKTPKDIRELLKDKQ